MPGLDVVILVVTWTVLAFALGLTVWPPLARRLNDGADAEQHSPACPPLDDHLKPAA